jgi:hypothetical protein
MVATGPVNSRFQFSLRWLFLATAAAAATALVYRVAGRDEAIGVASACVLAALGWRFRAHQFVKEVSFSMAAVVAWFSCIDFSWTVEHCRHCPSHWDVSEVRVLHRPVWSWRGPDHQSFHALVFEDLGSPCPHQVERWQKWRLWGLILPGEFQNGTCCLDGEATWYTSEVRQRVRELGRREPHLGEELREAVRNKDWTASGAIMARIHAQADP